MCLPVPKILPNVVVRLTSNLKAGGSSLPGATFEWSAYSMPWGRTDCCDARVISGVRFKLEYLRDAWVQTPLAACFGMFGRRMVRTRDT